MVMPEVKTLHPEWDSVPYQVKRTAVRDACRAMSNIKTFNLPTKSASCFQPDPNSKTQLTKWIDEVFETREDEHKRTLITNGRQKLKRNLSPRRECGSE